jgi:octaheme c-type cytochrome (tetrathionate reductase family)
MRTGIFSTVAIAVLLIASPAPATAAQAAAKPLQANADHSKFKVLQQQFNSGPEVTKACLSCHTEASKQIQKTEHWTWEYKSPEGQLLGKKHVINNFCTSITSNEADCAACHIGYGWKDEKAFFASEVNVDCLVCHDTTGKYKKPIGFDGNVVTRDTQYPPGSGKTIRAVDLKAVAQRVGKTSRVSCGACHFYGGGGDGVKHGDLDSSLEAPDKDLDVHMSAEGGKFVCDTCHDTQGHQVPGSRYAPTARDTGDAHLRGKEYKTSPTTCPACHGQTPHKKIAKLNDHTDKVACQTCHIPRFARGGVPTKMSWDWSTSGKRGPDGKPLVVKNADAYETYNGKKGDFVLAENVIPEYIWFNGKVKYTLRGDKIEAGNQPVHINHFEGSAIDGKSLIWPVKIFHGKQAYDPVGKTLVVTHLAGEDDSAYWENLNWKKAVATGMASVNAPFSGKVDFIETDSTWPITHMVAPKGKALGCVECHASGGRLEKVPGIYIPGRGRDHASWLDTAGWAIAALTLLGVLGHGLARLVLSRRKH